METSLIELYKKAELNIDIILLAMTGSAFEMGLEGMPAQLTGNCDLVLVDTLALSFTY